MSQHFAQPVNPSPAPAASRSTFRPKNNMGMAACSLLAVWPLAIVAIVHASSVHKKWDAGDKDGATKAATKAKNWAIASWCVAAVAFVIILGSS